MKKIKNIAIIAHVDHGKTTLVDGMLRQSGIFRSNQNIEERVMDSNDLEKERGITIFSKNASIHYKDFKINIVDTPGHSDFGGEVQRIMKMVDCVLLIVDAFEGPMPQTKYVLKKSLELGLSPIVVINKIDRPNSRPNEVLNMIFDLFVDLNATNEQLDFPVVYASAKQGIAKFEVDDLNEDLKPLFETIIKNVKEPEGEIDLPLQFLVSAIDYDNYLGRIGTGKVHNGQIAAGDTIMLMKQNGENVLSKVSKIFSYEGLKRTEIKKAYAGDIISIAGIEGIDVGVTLADKDYPVALKAVEIDEPTLAMTFMQNDSPFMGQEGKYVTSRHLWERLQREIQSNVSINIERSETGDEFIVKGRGELQMSILIENMRREGYEFQVSKPEVIFKEIDGRKCEPIELAVVDVADEFVGVVIEKMGIRKGEMTNMKQGDDGYTRVEFKVPSRGLIGFRGQFLTDTRGTGILNQSFSEYDTFKGPIPGRGKGVLLAMEAGISVPFALDNLQDRGELFIPAGVSVYEGMIVGENSREGDMVVNVCKKKALTNMRASGSDDAVRLIPHREFSLEQALEYIAEDELLEITPVTVRMRKKLLKELDRKRTSKRGE
ncbi:MAG: translational GTPase TypA [Spirochaetae bacterium HGW-Spirochaetae-5]|nr:MAG: translational GTPase TypA [Spirochaetae bacterium HGW-Spirochaetae-5]